VYTLLNIKSFFSEQVRPFAVSDLARGLEAQSVTVHMPQHGVESLLPFHYIFHSIVSKNVCIENSIVANRMEDFHTLPKDS
jgi:hypothetical protein